MADQVKIKKDKSTLTVSRKAFDTIYAAKGFEIVSEVKSDDADDKKGATGKGKKGDEAKS
jgi:hypothetical protein